MQRSEFHRTVEQKQVAVEQDQVASETYREGDKREEGVEQLFVQLRLLRTLLAALTEALDLALFLTEALHDPDSAENVLKLTVDLALKVPPAAVLHVHRRPEFLYQEHRERYRNEYEQAHKRVYRKHHDHRNDERHALNENIRQLIRDKILHYRGVAVDAPHKVAGRAPLQR